ncbi:putative DNA binding protein [Quillaja saponaria]|uniref:DNA binding protein n=1 Tax=Quillaja saponaria TaxID=32244 RepID=A0AAD7LHD7_QUISA|nr:putative DNA binding protein [Quillaja saponaria]
MNREHEISVQLWGTLEELLLASAVTRHGTKNWDSIAMEVQNRSSILSSLTPQNCCDKFNDLRQRYMSLNKDESTILVSMVDELRRIRMEELRREVQRRDISIVSLESKVKRLEEERERSLNKEEGAVKQRGAVDLKKDLESGRGHINLSPENLAEKLLSGDNSDYRENRSFNESNSTSQKVGGRENDVVEEQAKPGSNEPAVNGEDDLDPIETGSEPGIKCTCSGKSGEQRKDTAAKDESGSKASHKGRLGESNKARESKRVVKEGSSKQSSDVLSSASLTKEKRRRKVGHSCCAVSRGSRSSEETKGDEVSPATIRFLAIKSEPLVKLLEKIRSHRLSSMFERRLRSQETQKYKSLIRQHMDLQTVESRVEKGLYRGRGSILFHKFFRDLLLLFNNNIIFLKRNTPEHTAAKELRGLVLKEMTNYKLASHTIKPVKQEQHYLSAKPNRSSSSTKAISNLGGNNYKKGDKKGKDIVGLQKVERSSRNNKNSGGDHEYGGNELSSHDGLLVVKITEKKESVAEKKQGAAGFLKRMRLQNSSSTEQVDQEDDDSGDDDHSRDVKRRPRKVEEIRSSKRVTRSTSSGRRGGRELENGKGKRGVGRPAKRTEGNTSTTTAQAIVESAGSGKGRPKKRSRR